MQGNAPIFKLHGLYYQEDFIPMRKIGLYLLIVTSFVLTSCTLFRNASEPGYLTSLASPVSDLAMLKDYRTARVSSEDRPGNADFRVIEPRATLTLAELEGPGEITHIWTTISTSDPHHLRNLILRIYWDGNAYPSVESPIGDFFGLGHAKYYNFNNAMQAIGTDRGLNSFWPMPFARSARVVVKNESDVRIGAFYYYVDWRKFKTFPKDAGYFHAQYRQDFPCPDKKPYLILDTEGSRGHFIGVNLSIHTQVGGWWGEGDDIFTIDGEIIPSLCGTGSEDYFCGAWGFGETYYNEYFGMPLRESRGHGADNYWNVYRYHIENPVAFQNSLKVEIEHGSAGFDNTRSRGRNNDYSSVAYWYMERPVRLKGNLPLAGMRIPSFEIPPAPPGILEVNYFKPEAPQEVETGGQDMEIFSLDGASWLNGDHLFCSRNENGSVVKLSFETTEIMEGDLVFYMTKAPDYGIIRISLDDVTLVPEFNAYAEKVISAVIRAGQYKMEPGAHTLTVETLAKDVRSSNYLWGMDYIRIGGEPQEIEEKAEKKPDPASKKEMGAFQLFDKSSKSESILCELKR